MIDVPARLTGKHPLVPWLNRLRDAVQARTPKSSVHQKLRAGSDGFKTIPKPPGLSGDTVSPSGMNFRGLWIPAPPAPYGVGDVVVIQGPGGGAGTYVSIEDLNGNSPDTGIGWIQIAPGNTVGAWL